MTEPATQIFHPRYPKLKLFKTPNGKSQNWYAGFHHGGKNVRQSLGTTDFSAALTKSEEWFLDKQHSIRKGTFVPPAGTRFRSLIDAMLEYQATRRRSARYIAVAKVMLRQGGYIDQFFGKLPIERIDTSTWDEFRLWLTMKRADEGKPLHAETSMHQMKNLVRLVLKVAYVRGLIKSRPRFEDPYRDDKKDHRPRTRFSGEEWLVVQGACYENIRLHEEKGTRWVNDAKELYEFVRFMEGSGLRVGECRALRVCDVELINDIILLNGEEVEAEVCRIRIVGGKRGAFPQCTSDQGAAWMFRSIVERRGIKNPATCKEPLFLKHHRDMFRRILQDRGLHIDGYGRRRDFVSLRHTYICRKLEHGVSTISVAKNTRTSVTMIEQHYARDLPITSRMINQSTVRPWQTKPETKSKQRANAAA